MNYYRFDRVFSVFFLGLGLFLCASFARANDEPSSGGSLTAPVSLSTGLPGGTTVQPPVEPFLPPLAGKRLVIVSGFGQRQVPNAVGKIELHEGIDYRVTPGASVRASRSGKILFAGFSTAYVSRKDKKDKHRFVIVRHEDGMSSRYVHLNTLSVQHGQAVKAGAVLGTAAPSDEGKEPVLHFEIRNAVGKALDPEEVFHEASPQ